MDARIVLAAVIAAFVVVRVIESLINRNHTKRVVAQGAVAVRPDGFLGIAAVQALALAGLVGEGFLLPDHDPILWIGTWPLLALAACALALRHWCIATLGDRWTFRVWILPAQPLVRRGPYRFLHHPNYLAVFLEYVAVPAAFGLWFTAAVVIPLGAWSLLHRKRIEENALRPLRRPIEKTG
jgi:methyltransferase